MRFNKHTFRIWYRVNLNINIFRVYSVANIYIVDYFKLNNLEEGLGVSILNFMAAFGCIFSGYSFKIKY